MTPDPTKLAQFVFRAVDGHGSAGDAVLVVVGERLGLYRALASAGGLTVGELAARTGTSESYLHEWLTAQAGGGYVGYHPAEARYSLSPEQAVALTDEDSPAYLPGFFRLALRLRSRGRLAPGGGGARRPSAATAPDRPARGARRRPPRSSLAQ
jgi:hypothetical protein